MLKTSIIILVLFLFAFGGFVLYDLATAKKRKEVYRVKSSATAYLMLLPAVILAFLFILLPILYSLGYAFTDYYLLRPNDINFIYLDNFKDFFEELATIIKNKDGSMEMKVSFAIDEAYALEGTLPMGSKTSLTLQEIAQIKKHPAIFALEVTPCETTPFPKKDFKTASHRWFN